ncbi:MAG: hypothetical protein ACI4A5_06255 [Hominilimicola sp.]
MPECIPCKHEQQIHDLERKVNSLEIANARIETVLDALHKNVAEIKTDVKSLVEKPVQRAEKRAESVLLLIIGAIITVAVGFIAIRLGIDY